MKNKKKYEFCVWCGKKLPVAKQKESILRRFCSKDCENKYYAEDPEELYNDLFRVYYSEKSGDDLKNWRDGEKWGKDYERDKKRKNILYYRFALLKGIIHEIKTNRHAFTLSDKEKDWARQMIKAVNFDGRDETKVIVSVIVLTKLNLNPNRVLEDYDNLLSEYQVSHGYVFKIEMSLPDKFLSMNRESGEIKEEQTVMYKERDNGELELIFSGNDNEYFNSDNIDYSWDDPDLIE